MAIFFMPSHLHKPVSQICELQQITFSPSYFLGSLLHSLGIPSRTLPTRCRHYILSEQVRVHVNTSLY